MFTLHLTFSSISVMFCFLSHFAILEFGWTAGLQVKGGMERRGWFIANFLHDFYVMQ